MNKEGTIAFKIEKDCKEKFEEICNKNFSNPSRELQIFIYKTIKKDEQDKAKDS